MAEMFHECKSLTSLDLSSFDTSKVTNMGNMFADCNSLTSLDLSRFDTRNVTTTARMFYNCQSFTSLDLSSFDTRNTTLMYSMFEGCSSLKKLDLSGFDTSEVTHIHCMFERCGSLEFLDLSGFNMSNDIYNYRCLLFADNIKSVKCTQDTYDKLGFDSVVERIEPSDTIRINKQPANVERIENATAKFTIETDCSDVKYQWYWRKDSSSAWAKSYLTGYNTPTLSVYASAGKNGYQYCCKITKDGKTSKSAPATLTVTSALKIKTQPTSVSKKINSTAKFTVESNYTDATYQWYWRKDSSSAWAKSYLTGYNTPTLSVYASAGKNGYQYCCKVTKDGKTVSSDAATLTVTDK